MKLGEITKDYRSKNDISLRKLAEDSGLSHSYIAALEKVIDPRYNKPILPTTDTIIGLSKGMHITPEELISNLDDDQKILISNENNLIMFSNFQLCNELGKRFGIIPYNEKLSQNQYENIEKALKNSLKK